MPVKYPKNKCKTSCRPIEVLIELQQIGVTPEFRDCNTIEDVLAEAAKVVAEKCVLSAGKIVNVFCHLYVRMGERQKKNIFGDLVSLTATSGSPRSLWPPN